MKMKQITMAVLVALIACASCPVALASDAPKTGKQVESASTPPQDVQNKRQCQPRASARHRMGQGLRCRNGED